MSDRLSPQSEAAYRRAVSAYQQGSSDEAQRWAREALAIEPAHAAAAALLRRLGGRDAGPQVVSTDPRDLISRSGGYERAEAQDPTIVVPRKTAQAASPPKRNPAPPGRQPWSSASRASEPTVIVPSSNGRSAAPGNASFDRPAGSLWHRLLGGGGRWDGGFSAGVSTARGRGILIVGGAIAVAALSVWGIIAASRLIWPDGERLTIEVAEGGRIVGDDVRCGGSSRRCSAAVPTGERVELTAEAEPDYEFAGFTGDCEAGRGILLMDGPKTCGARFERVVSRPSGTKYTLSIEKPKGGTVLFLDVITCGTLGSDCSEEIRADELVTLRYQADDGHRFDSFFGECKGGEFVMNSARTCGAVFLAAPGPTVNNPPSAAVAGPGPSAVRRRNPDVPDTDPPTSGKTSTPSVTKPVPPPSTPSGTVPPPVAPPEPAIPVNAQGVQGGKPVPPPLAPDDMETHAKKEIKQRLDEYCSALESLKPEEVLKVFPRQDARTLRRQFEDHKSLKCAWTSEPKYNRFDIGAANGSASAQVEIGMKQTSQMQSGGNSKPQETTVTIDLSRPDLRSRWKIDDMRAAEKK